MGEGILLNPSSNTKPLSSYSAPMSTISEITRKAINLTFQNKKLMLKVFILYLSPLLILVLLHSLIATPFIAKVEDGYETSSLNHQDLISLVVIELPLAFAFCLLLLFAFAVTILATISAHQGASVSLIDILLYIKSTWQKIVIPGFYVSFTTIVFIGVSICLTKLNLGLGVLAALTYPYLASINTVVLVISIVEDECHGAKVFGHAREIITQGRLKGYFLMLMLILLRIPVYVMFYVTLTDDDDEIDSVIQYGFVMVSTVLFCLANFFSNVTYAVFYQNYKQLTDEKTRVPKNTVSFEACDS